MNKPDQLDPYNISRESLQEAPTNFRQKLKYLGPGFILSASVVGSGELIATTSLGAKAGFVTLWVILVSCLVKVVLQLEFGRQSITRGISAMNLMNELPGPRFGKQKVSWAAWSWLVLWLVKPLQLGGIIGGVAIILNIAISSLSIAAWTIITAMVVISVMLFGFYNVVEKISLVFMGLFTSQSVNSEGFWPALGSG